MSNLLALFPPQWLVVNEDGRTCVQMALASERGTLHDPTLKLSARIEASLYRVRA